MAKLAKQIYNKENGLTYTLHVDYYFPEIALPEDCRKPLGRWGMMAMDYLKEHHPIRFNNMLLNGTLFTFLHGIEDQARQRYGTLMDGYKRCWGITEELKANDQMKWVQLMSLARSEAENNIVREIICG